MDYAAFVQVQSKRESVLPVLEPPCTKLGYLVYAVSILASCVPSSAQPFCETLNLLSD